MVVQKGAQRETVIGPNGTTISIDDLPPTNTTRWVIHRKAEVVAAVQGGLISLDEACSRYSLSVEEFLSWQTAFAKDGLAGLKVTKAKH